MNKIKRILTAVLLMLVGVGGCLTLPSYAAEENKDENELPATWLQISPSGAAVTLEGGEVIQAGSSNCPVEVEDPTNGKTDCAVEVKNIGSKSFTYKLYVAPMTFKSGNEVDFSSDSSATYTQIARWTTLYDDMKKEYVNELYRTIAPNETQKIHYRISVPDDVPGGAQYAAIFAQTTGSTASGTGVSTIAQVASQIYGRSIGDTVQTATIDDYNFTRFTLGGKLTAHASFKNTGNTDFNARYSYKAMTLFGKELYSDEGSTTTFPGVDYDFDVVWDNPPMLGIFSVQFKVTAADAVRDETHIVVIMPIFIMILLILLLTVIIVWIIIIIRKRKERKARTLV